MQECDTSPEQYRSRRDNCYRSPWERSAGTPHFFSSSRPGPPGRSRVRQGRRTCVPLHGDHSAMMHMKVVDTET